MKKYLKNEFEVIKELKNGKTVYEEYYPFYHYIMIDGIICGECSKNTRFLINCPMDMDSKFYIEEEEKQLKFETGKFYRTRDGRRAYCFFKEEDGFYNFVIDGQRGCGTYAEDGLVLIEEENPDDIVDYWEE